MTNADHKALRQRLLDFAVAAGDGTVTTADLAATNGSLTDAGYSSLSYMRLIDMIENELGVYLDPDADDEAFQSIDSITQLVLTSGDGVDA